MNDCHVVRRECNAQEDPLSDKNEINAETTQSVKKVCFPFQMLSHQNIRSSYWKYKYIEDVTSYNDNCTTR